ncbi:MAG: DUF4351 domain-containing protein [Acidobacteria bacterium]|nr:DUF4351 domain-containing protein [Acidobacteriota bacterium]
MKLTAQEQATFEKEIAKLEPRRRKKVMEFTTSWMREGIKVGLKQGEERGLKKGKKLGLEQGKRQEAQALILRLLNRQIGAVSVRLQGRVKALSLAQLEKLGEALLEFSNKNDLIVWLEKIHPPS